MKNKYRISKSLISSSCTRRLQHQPNQMLHQTFVDVSLSQDHIQPWQSFRKGNDLCNDIPLAQKQKVVGIRSGSHCSTRVGEGSLLVKRDRLVVCIPLKTRWHLWERCRRPKSKRYEHRKGRLKSCSKTCDSVKPKSR